MLFAVIRIFISLCILTIGLFLTRKFGITHKNCLAAIVSVLTVAAYICLSLVPLENLFVTFSSLQSAYYYNHSKKIETIVEGKKSDFIIASEKNTESHSIVPKSDNGWKLGMGTDIKTVSKTVSDAAIACVYQYKNTNDYYIAVYCKNSGTFDVSDNQNSEFKFSKRYINGAEEYHYTCYAYINNFNEQYVLTVDGQQIKIKNDFSNSI